MRQVYLGNTLINDVFLGADRMDDVLQQENILYIDWLLVGGGASGGSRRNSGFGGGGGAGRFVSSSIDLLPSSSINVTIGNGGASRAIGDYRAGENGVSSSVIISGTTYSAPGGGAGGCGGEVSKVIQSGSNGGSGGGAGSFGGTLPPGAPGGTTINGTPIAGFGGIGGNGQQNIGSDGGGAAGSRAGLAWLDGVTYCEGGIGFDATVYTARGNGGNGGSNDTPSGAGIAGVFKLRYPGPPKATGGTITQSGGYTYHEFTASGTFTY